MNEYYLELAGLRTHLRSAQPIRFSQKLQPFLCAPWAQADCTITAEPCDRLEHWQEDGIWNGASCYDRHDGAQRIFHCPAAGESPMAVSQLFSDGSVLLRYHPDYSRIFTGSASLFNFIGTENLLLQHGGLLLHAALVRYKEQALAFAGPSGVGKSTHAAFWSALEGAQVLNGDRTALRRSAGVWQAYGSHCAGTSGIYTRGSAPLAAILVLRQAGENRLTPLSKGQAFRLLYPELTVHHWDKAFTADVTDLCMSMLDSTPVYLLECRPEPAAAELVIRRLKL